jgi:Uma2 family endonuclease
MSVAAEKRSWTYEELIAEGLDPEGYEIVNGDLVEVKPVDYEGGRLFTQLAMILGEFVRANKLGDVLITSRFLLRKAPRLERRPDLAFVSKARRPDPPKPELYSGAPDLAIEVLSPSDRVVDATSKAEEYVACGAREAWSILPQAKVVIVFQPDAPPRPYGVMDVLESPSVLPGLTISLERLFAQDPPD